MVWGETTAGRETTCPNCPIGCSAPTEINKDLLTDWQTSWLTHCLQTTSPSMSQVPSLIIYPQTELCQERGPQPRVRWLERARKLHLSMEKDCEETHPTTEKNTFSKEGGQLPEQEPRDPQTISILFPLLYSPIIGVKCIAAVLKQKWWFYFHTWGCLGI